MNIHLLGPTQTCSCDARHVCQSCQGQDDVNAKLLAALEAGLRTIPQPQATRRGVTETGQRIIAWKEQARDVIEAAK